MHLGKSTRLATTVLPLPLGYGWLHPSSAQLPPEVGAVVTLVSSQASWALARSPLRPGHLHLVDDLKTHRDFRYIGCCHQKSQGQSIAFSHQMDGTALAFPAVGDIFAPVLPGTKLPSRKAWLQSSLAWESRVLSNFKRIRSQTPWSCHSWRRRWQVERLPYFGGRSFQRAPERSTHRIPSRVRRSSALGLPLRLCCGSNGAISPHCSSPNSSSFTSNPSSRGSGGV